MSSNVLLFENRCASRRLAAARLQLARSSAYLRHFVKQIIFYDGTNKLVIMTLANTEKTNIKIKHFLLQWLLRPTYNIDFAHNNLNFKKSMSNNLLVYFTIRLYSVSLRFRNHPVYIEYNYYMQVSYDP